MAEEHRPLTEVPGALPGPADEPTEVGLDPTVALLADPPLPPLPEAELTRDRLTYDLHRLIACSAELDLSRWFWGEGVVLGGLVDAALALGEPIHDVVPGFFAHHRLQQLVIEHVNNLAPGSAAARLGDAAVGDRLLAWLDSPGAATFDANGAVEHWPGGVWADTAYMMGTFLVHHGRLVGREDLVQRAAEQWLAHADILQDTTSGLMAHGSHRGEVPPCRWGRANAWLALAACELLDFHDGALDATVEQQVRERLAHQLSGVRDCLPPAAVWYVLMDGHPETRGIVETSAAAGLVAALLRAAALGIDPDANRRTGRTAMLRLHPYLDERGGLTQTSAGTVLQLIPFGYSVIRTDRLQLWGQGLGLHGWAAALRHLI
ncbi:hypothetical protein HJ590_14270 [Naumannella sp. ID2617S]|nr:hypothetical protein [Naumannella sp. ID2617S]